MNKVNTSAKSIAILYAVITTIIFCLHLFATKIILRDVPPIIFASVRGILGGLILLLFFRDGIKYITKKSFLSLSIIAFLGFFLNQIFFMYGMKLSTTTNAAIIINTIPIASTMMAIITKLR